MTRRKVKLQFIPNDSARKATFRKRKNGFVKKASELTTLCGIDVCAVISSPYDAQPEIWPSPAEAQRVYSRFKELPEMEQSKKMVDQESYLKQRINKAYEQFKKHCKENREEEVAHVMYQGIVGGFSTAGFTIRDLRDLQSVVDRTLGDVNRVLANGEPSQNNNNNPQAQMVGSGDAAAAGAGLEMQQQQQQQPQWLMDMMNSHAQDNAGFGVGGAGDDMILPFLGGDENLNPNPSTTNNMRPNQSFP